MELSLLRPSPLRIHRELQYYNRDPPSHLPLFTGPIDDDFFHYRAAIIGPDHSPYAGGVFYLDIHYPETYPVKPPFIAFITKVYHCNVSHDGGIYIDILKDKWTPALTAIQVIFFFVQIMILIFKLNYSSVYQYAHYLPILTLMKL